MTNEQESILQNLQAHMDIILTQLGMYMVTYYMSTEIVNYIHGFLITM